MYVRDYKKLTAEKEELMLDAPNEETISAYSKDVLFHWQAPEFEVFERDQKWFLIISLILSAIIGYAIYTNSLIMAITFILIGVVGYLHINRTPRVLDFRIAPEGIIAGEKELYPFENIKSFWIFYELDNKKVVSLHMESYLIPFIHIPIDDQDPVVIREILLRYIPEIKQEPSAVDSLERFLGI
jgi:hypothetical protein